MTGLVSSKGRLPEGVVSETQRTYAMTEQQNKNKAKATTQLQELLSSAVDFTEELQVINPPVSVDAVLIVMGFLCTGAALCLQPYHDS